MLVLHDHGPLISVDMIKCGRMGVAICFFFIKFKNLGLKCETLNLKIEFVVLTSVN